MVGEPHMGQQTLQEIHGVRLDNEVVNASDFGPR